MRHADSTIVVFFGDNGQAMVRGKPLVDGSGLRIPLIIRWRKSFPAPQFSRRERSTIALSPRSISCQRSAERAQTIDHECLEIDTRLRLHPSDRIQRRLEFEECSGGRDDEGDAPDNGGDDPRSSEWLPVSAAWSTHAVQV